MRAAFAALVLFTAAAAARGDEYSRAGIGAPFLRLGVGARALALGEAYAALADDASAVYWNPAALVRVEKRSAVLVHSEALGAMTLDYAAYVQNLGRFGAAGGAFHYLSAGEISGTDASGVETGTFRPVDVAAAFSYAYRFRGPPPPTGKEERDLPDVDLDWSFMEGWSFGATGKYVRSRIIQRSQTATFDFGALSPEYFRGLLRFAAVAQNIGGALHFDRETELLPSALRLGAALSPAKGWLVGLEGVAPRESPPYGSAGAEYRRVVRPGWSGAARLGINSRTLGEVSGINGVSAGVGLSFLKYSLDYAVVPWGSLGTHHQVSVAFGF